MHTEICRSAFIPKLYLGEKVTRIVLKIEPLSCTREDKTELDYCKVAI